MEMGKLIGTGSDLTVVYRSETSFMLELSSQADFHRPNRFIVLSKVTGNSVVEDLNIQVHTLSKSFPFIAL